MLKLNAKPILALGLIAIFLFQNSCKKDDDNNSGSGANSTVTFLTVADVGDAGNGTDLQVSFSKIPDETKVQEYQIFVVLSSESADFNSESAENVSENNSISVAKTGNNISLNLSAGAKTTSGDLITNDVPYKVFVMSATSDPDLYLNALSSASPEITLVDNTVNPTVGEISNLTVADVANAGNATDLQITFSKVADESKIESYQVLVVKSDESGDFDLGNAEAVSLDNLTTIAKTGNDISINLPEDAKTNTGELVSEEIPYKVFVLILTADSGLYPNALSAPSEEITLSSQQKVKVTYIANDGVMIEYQGKKVVIDAINRASNLSGWVTPSNAAYMAVENGVAPYDDIDIIMITHNHGDHYNVSAVANYLSDHPNTKLVVPNSIKPNFSAFSSQIVNFSLPKFERINLEINDITLDVLHIEHFDQFGNDFSQVESYAYVVHFNDKRFLHAGDIDYIDSDLEVFNLLDDNITVAFIPTFGDLVSTTNRDALMDNVDPENIVCLHFLTGSMATTLNQVNAIYPNAEVFTTPFETIEY